jgi:hypothetical protein
MSSEARKLVDKNYVNDSLSMIKYHENNHFSTAWSKRMTEAGVDVDDYIKDSDFKLKQRLFEI